jgi:hypothetical protein
MQQSYRFMLITQFIGAHMNKKNANKILKSEDQKLIQAFDAYKVGNFFKARQLAKRVLSLSSSTDEAHKDARALLVMTTPDLRALGAGIIVLFCTILIAFIVSF